MENNLKTTNDKVDLQFQENIEIGDHQKEMLMAVSLMQVKKRTLQNQKTGKAMNSHKPSIGSKH